MVGVLLPAAAALGCPGIPGHTRHGQQSMTPNADVSLSRLRKRRLNATLDPGQMLAVADAVRNVVTEEATGCVPPRPRGREAR
jgi:hypothetical protein